MDHTDLLNQIAKHMDEKTSLMRNDIGKLDEKLDQYQERLVRVESNMGFIKGALALVVSVVTSVIAYVISRYVDFTGSK